MAGNDIMSIKVQRKRLEITIEVGDVLWIEEGGVGGIKFLSDGMSDWGNVFDGVAGEIETKEIEKRSLAFKLRLIYLSVGGGVHGPPFERLNKGDEFTCRVRRKVMVI